MHNIFEQINHSSNKDSIYREKWAQKNWALTKVRTNLINTILNRYTQIWVFFFKPCQERNFSSIIRLICQE